jgi:RNA-directed DNA polymerase
MKASNQKCENQSTDDKPNEWKNIPWRKLERKVYKLQKRIYTASQRGETLKVRKLQKLMIKSRAAKLLAVRQVTQENKGKKTAGVDGVKALSPRQRLELAKNLRIDGKAMPTRRVWIDKPGRDQKRPLGIPVMRDRAKQKLVELALDPEWEARFEPNSYGFRKGRSCPDAIDAINSSIQKMPKWVLDADIAKCFDRVRRESRVLGASALYDREAVLSRDSLLPIPA